MDFKYFTSPQMDQGRYLFVSDLHGSNKQFGLLSDIAAKRPPKIVFFLGDVIGTQSLADLQKLFYNGVVNPTKKLLLEINPNASDKELLDFINPENRQAVLMGYQALCDYLKKLDGQDHSQPNPAEHVRQLIEYQHFGHWISNLSESVRNVLKLDLHQNAIEVIDLMNQFVKNHCKVVVLEGNWDARTPLDFLPGKKCVPTPIRKREFYFRDLINQFGNHVKYYRQPSVIEETDCFFIIWPFDAAATPTRIPEIESKGKKIVLVSHAQISWKPIKGDIKMNPENQAIEQNMPMVVDDLNADTAIHGHLHQLLPNNASGYIFDNHILVHYLPIDTFRFISF